MRSSHLVIVSLILAAATARARTENQVSIASDGWTVTADGDQAVVSIACDNLGNVLEEVRLNLRSDHGLRPLRKWSVEKKGKHQLSIRTAQPQTVWLFDLGPDTLKISSTSTAAVLTAGVPAPSNRIPVRILDRQGFPVDWLGTDEVANGAGGAYTRNQSFLPSRNPEVMYFQLGQVASSNFHDLFDRRTDIVIRFPGQALLQRNNQNPDLLDATIPVPGNTLVSLVPDYFTKTLGVPFYVPFDDSYFRRAPMVWSSWTSYYDEVREEDIVRNADWIAANLKPYGFEYVELDDGYDCGNCKGFVGGGHRWIENWDREKFPHGPEWLAGYIKSKGLHAGLWLVPNAYAGAEEQHPDWYLRDKEGKIIQDYATPAFDSTHPQVLAFLKTLFTTLDDWGFEYYKFDGEHALPKYIPAVDRDRLYDKSVDPIIAYRNRLKLIRETLGPRRFVEGCPSGTPLNGIGYFNSYFNGADVYNSWRGMYALFSSINANAFLNHIVVYVMPGEGIDIGPPMTLGEAKQKRNPTFLEIAGTREQPMMGFGTTLAEARTLVTYLSLSGVAYSVASVMPELPEERVKLLKQTLPSMPILPADLFSRGTVAKWDTFKDIQPDDYIHNYPEILDLKVNAKSGVYDVVGLTNWRSTTAEKELCFADQLGLDPGSHYIAFDFWGQKLLGVFKDCIKAEIGPHDTRVLLIHPLLSRPQLLGNSRHITGAYSITDQAWDDAKNVLRGTSDTMPGDSYALWFHVPEGTKISEVKVTTKNGNVVPVRRKLQGTFFEISFPGQHDPVDWAVHFAQRLSASVNSISRSQRTTTSGVWNPPPASYDQIEKTVPPGVRKPIAALATGQGNFFDSQSFDPCILVDPTDSTKLLMFFSGMAAPVSSGVITIGRATSTVADPTTWTVSNSGNPVLNVGGSRAWDHASIRQDSCFYDSGTLYMFYSGSNGIIGQIGLATSSDNGLTWTKYSGNPVLTPAGQGRNDGGDQVSQGAVLKEGSKWTMIYAYDGSTILPGYRYATSSNGTSWSKGGSGDILSCATARYCEFHQFFKIGSDYVLLYETGSTDKSWEIWAAKSSTATGNYTNSSRNPWLTKSGTVGAFDRYHVSTPFLIQLGSKLYLYESGAKDFDQPYTSNHWPLGVTGFTPYPTR